jgi:cytochrome c biogenesis protein CcmG/thiol:disulfide interchange protein DsbE
MKNQLLALGMLLLSTLSIAQNETANTDLKKLPSVSLRTMDGEQVNTSALGFKGPVIITFWASWCPTCKREMGTLNELYSDWREETGVTIVAVSVDDEKTRNNVPTLVNANGWEFLVLMDPNGDFKRAMGVNNTPHTFLINENGEIVYSRNNYAPGDEDLLHEALLKLKK